MEDSLSHLADHLKGCQGRGSDFSGAMKREEEFTRLLIHARHSIYAYVRILVPDAGDAEDCLQEVSLQLWRKFDEFDRAKSFPRWARGFVRRVAKNYHRKLRPHYLALDDALIDRLAKVQGAAQELLELRRERLKKCLSQLSVSDRELIRGYYKNEESVVRLSELLGRTQAAIYKALRRSRLTLLECVDRQLGKGN